MVRTNGEYSFLDIEMIIETSNGTFLNIGSCELQDCFPDDQDEINFYVQENEKRIIDWNTSLFLKEYTNEMACVEKSDNLEDSEDYESYGTPYGMIELFELCGVLIENANLNIICNANDYLALVDAIKSFFGFNHRLIDEYIYDRFICDPLRDSETEISWDVCIDKNEWINAPLPSGEWIDAPWKEYGQGIADDLKKEFILAYKKFILENIDDDFELLYAFENGFSDEDDEKELEEHVKLFTQLWQRYNSMTDICNQMLDTHIKSKADIKKITLEIKTRGAEMMPMNTLQVMFGEKNVAEMARIFEQNNIEDAFEKMRNLSYLKFFTEEALKKLIEFCQNNDCCEYRKTRQILRSDGMIDFEFELL